MNNEEVTQAPGLKYPDDYRPLHKLDKVTEKNYKPADALGMYHVKQEKLQTNSQGVRVSKPTIQTYSARSWGRDKENLIRMGERVVVIYDPTDYLAEQEALAAERNAMAAQPKITADIMQQAIQEALATQAIQHKADIDALRTELAKAPTKGSKEAPDNK